MKKHLLVAACVAALAVPAATPSLAQSLSEKSGLNSLVGAAPSTADFVKEAAISDMFEIQSSQLAAERGDDATKTYAKQMIEEHQKTTSELKGLVQGGKVQATLPTELDSAHQSKLDKLKGLQGNDFNKQYHSDQVKAHKDAVDLFGRYAKSGDNAELKTWATKTQPHLDHHLKMAQDLDK
ncbi:DUF4142 domain-containing protein [Methylobacterium oxalidis]|uniref:DUF4142 domain-containing protein n=1 Tax=Methylobacterium oxalidis TaxID=944322 RepID=UPI0033151A80